MGVDTFAEIGRQHIMEQIEALEESRPGQIFMFYLTGSYEGDMAAATALREAYDMPRPVEVTTRMVAREDAYADAVEMSKALCERHDQRVQNEWSYWLLSKLGLVKDPRY